MIQLTRTALVNMTEPQRIALLRLTENLDNGAENLWAYYGPFDLPPGYFSFVIDYKDGRKLVGGISPEGQVST